MNLFVMVLESVKAYCVVTVCEAASLPPPPFKPLVLSMVKFVMKALPGGGKLPAENNRLYKSDCMS